MTVNQSIMNQPIGNEQLDPVAETARWTAASRARESDRPDRLFNDPWAGLLAGPQGRALLAHFHTSRAAADGNPFLPIRTRWFDDHLSSTPCRQIVGFGAGMDTRAFRLDWPADTVVFEIDQPELLRYKAARLSAAGASPRCDRRTIESDLGEEWDAALLRAGYDPAVPTAWFGEGVLFYLPEALAHDVVSRAAALSAPGSTLAVDLIGTGIFRFPYTRDFMAKLERAGSPWQFGTDDPGQFITDCGWRVDVLTEPGGPGASYGRWEQESTPEGFPDLPRSFLVAATKLDQEGS
jgi:methyltransferase (TIGR00027 family)